MAGITLAQAETNLQLWVDAQANVGPERTVTIGDRTLGYHNLADIQKMIEFWDRKVKELTRGSRVGYQRAVIYDD